MKRLKQMLVFALILALTACGVSAAAEEGEERVLELPGMLTSIEDRAFYGNAALDRVVLPSGLDRIGAEAFAQSSLNAINLPGTITFIAENAFAGTNISVVAAPAGSYAHQRAIEIGLLAPLTLNVEMSDETVEYEDPVSWTAVGGGGQRPHHYTFTVYRNDELYESEEIVRENEPVGDGGSGGDEGAQPAAVASEAVFTYTFVRPGEYRVLAVLEDENGETEEYESPTLTLEGPNVIRLDSVDSTFRIVKAYTWTAEAEGGEEPYEYKFVVKSGENTLYTRGYSTKQTLNYSFFKPGSYTITAQATDQSGVQTKPKTLDVTVLSSNVTIKGVVRIYVDIDKNNKVLRTNSHTGHYELQINNSKNNKIAFDDRIYTNPAFSFGKKSSSNSAGVISVSNGDQILRSNSRLYTFKFSTTADKLEGFIFNLYDCMDLPNKIRDGDWRRYDVTRSGGAGADFRTYNIKTCNCFTAVATWSKWLGYNTLSNIVDSSSSYTNYIAWRMLDRYGGSWTYVGKKN